MSSNMVIPDTSVQPQPERRSFTAEYKQQILAEADACENGSLGALLRREGLYYSHLTTWRERRSQAQIDSLRAHKRGPKTDQTAAQIERLQHENAQLKSELTKSQLIIEVQKKLSLQLMPDVPAPILMEALIPSR